MSTSTATTMIDRRLPAHLAVLVGVSAGVYAVSLAGVTALQSSADARLRTQREPIQLAADTATANHDALEARLEDAARRYEALATRYGSVGDGLAGMEGDLGSLATRAAALTESAASLPTKFALPKVHISVPRAASAPKTHATTRASGG